jgi:hypothetical protein
MVNPNTIGGGNMGQPGGQPQVDYEKAYKELEQRIGTQGKELGEYRNFFNGVAPLLDVLDKSPQLVQAIIDGKIDEGLATAVAEGKVTVGEAQAITQAHAEVKQELGKQAYVQASPEDISKLVESRIAGVEQKMASQFKEAEEIRTFESQVNDFISRTPDFADYSEAIDEWLEDHDEITDISVAYWAVKGQLSTQEANNQARANQAEMAKNQALNMGGGGGGAIGGGFPEGVNPIDVLISGSPNPNIF